MAGNNNKNKHQKPKYTKQNATDATKKTAPGRRQDNPTQQAREIDINRIIVDNPIISNPVKLPDFEAMELKGGSDKVRINTPMTRTENLKNTAPYNFVRLNTQVVLPPVGNYIGDKSSAEERIKAYKEYIGSKGEYAKHTGYFDITIENLTPLYIGDGSEFFNDGKNKCIPGSSIRGAIKNLFSIITNSGFKAGEDFVDKNLYYRIIAVTNTFAHLRENYDNVMKDAATGNLMSKAGYLVRKNNAYFIIPSEKKYAKKLFGEIIEDKSPTGLTEYRYYVGLEPTINDRHSIIWHDNYVDVFSGFVDTKKRFYRISRPNLSISPIPIYSDILTNYFVDNSKERMILCSLDRSAEIKNVENGSAQNPQNPKVFNQNVEIIYQNFLSTTYSFSDHKYVPVTEKGPDDDDFIKSEKLVPWQDARIVEAKRKVLDFFAPDREPLTEPSKLLIGLEEYDYVIPCFYQDDGKQVTSFGANPYYRIPYNHKIGDHVNEQLQTDLVDFTKAIFGSKEHWGSRVFFENCYLDSSSKATMDKHESIPLRTPNPTSFQNYLEQHDAKVEHWDTEATQIRGYKLYWHRNMEWKADTELQGNNKTILNPIVSKVKFKGRIKFESLDDVELGALVELFALLKKSNMAMKLGMGKSIGLGSVKVNADLYEEGKNYYTTLFDDKGILGYELSQSKDKYQSAFKSYMDKALSEQGTGSQENYTLRMRELEKMLSIEKIQDKEFIDRTNYLPFDKNGREVYVKKVVLPDIETVFKG